MERQSTCCCLLCGNDFQVTLQQKKEMNGNYLCDACVKALAQDDDSKQKMVRILGDWINQIVSGYKAKQTGMAKSNKMEKEGDKKNDGVH